MSITSANATLLLGVDGVFDSPQELYNFSVDDVYSVEDMEIAETQMSVDGYLTAGFVHVPIKQSLMFLGDSPSIDFFDTWYAAQKADSDIYYAFGTIILPSRGSKFTHTRGVLSSYRPMPDAGKTLKPVKYTITWQSITPSTY